MNPLKGGGRRETALQIDFDFVCCSVIRLNADLRRWPKNAEQSSWTPRRGLALGDQKKLTSGHLQRELVQPVILRNVN